MRRTLTIDEALADRNLLGSGLGDVRLWSTWRAVLKGAFGLSLKADERALFGALAGGRAPPPARVQELWAIVGRRGGKSRMAAAIGCYLACLSSRKRLSAGEVGEVAIIAASLDQSKVVFNYIVGFLEASPVLSKEIVSLTKTEVSLRGNVVLSSRAGNFRTVRGRTLLACVLDEVAFFRDETSAYADIELYRAVLPALATTKGLLIGISTPYRRVGLLHQKHRDYFGVDDPSVLVVVGTSQQFNPTLDDSVIERARASDPEGSRAEWDAEFRSDLASFLDDATIESVIDHSRPLELPPSGSRRYGAFVDPSGGRHDAFTLCIGHREGDRFVADVVRGARPPFDPQEVASGYAGLLKEYRVTQVHGDNYSGDWVVNAFKECGVRYVRAEKAKSGLYLEALPLFTRGLMSIPEHGQLLKELRLLERATHRSGKDSVDHGRYGSDDYANAVCGAAAHGSRLLSVYGNLDWVDVDAA